MNNTEYLPMVAAVISGCCLLFLLLLLFLVLALVYRYLGEQERTMMVKTPKGAAAFYGGLEPSSVDFLVSRSLTNSGIITNSGSSHSVAGVYYNSGFEVSNNSLSGSGDLGFHIVSADVISRRPTPSTYV